MKKEIMAIAITAACLFTGCARGEVRIVDFAQPAEARALAAEPIKASNEQAEQPAAQQGASKTVAEMVQAPERFQTTIERGKLKVQVDAPVKVPQVQSMSVLEVMPADFTQEQVTAFLKAFDLEDGVCSDGRRTKKDLQWDLEFYKKMKETSKNAEPNMNYESQEFYDALIAEIEAELLTAPEKNEYTPTTGKLQTINTEDEWYIYRVDNKLKGVPFVTYTALNAMEMGENGQYARCFSVQNNDDRDKRYVLQGDASDGSLVQPRKNAMMMYDVLETVNYGLTGAIEVQRDEQLDADLLAKVKLTPAQAADMVEQILKDTNTPMEISKITIIDDEQNGLVDDLVSPAKNYRYQIFCERVMDGVALDAVVQMIDYANSDPTMADWYPERMKFMLDDTGIRSMNWDAPVTVGAPMEQNVELLPFEEIRHVFETMMAAKYDLDEQDTAVESMDLDITSVQLVLMRTTQDGCNGKLVPAWRFSGVRAVKFSGEEKIYPSEESSVLILDARDGSVMDAK